MHSLMVALLVDERFLVLRKRGRDEELLKGLWEFPTRSWKQDDNLSKAQLKAARAELFELCFGKSKQVPQFEETGSFKHVFSHIDEGFKEQFVLVVFFPLAVSVVRLELVRVSSKSHVLTDSKEIRLVESVGGNGEAKSTKKAFEMIKRIMKE